MDIYISLILLVVKDNVILNEEHWKYLPDNTEEICCYFDKGTFPLTPSIINCSYYYKTIKKLF